MFGNIFTGIKKVKKGGNYAPRLPKGQHQVALKKFGPKETKEDSEVGSHLLESSWLVCGTNSQEVAEGDTRDWPWFTEKGGHAGKFAKENAQSMIEAIMRSIDLSELPKNAQGQILHPLTGQPMIEADRESPSFGKPKLEHDVASIGEIAADGFFRGIQLRFEGVDSYNKKEKKFRIDNATGKPFVEALWKPIAGQTLASIAEFRAVLDQLDPPETPAQTAAATAQAQPAPTANMGGYAVQAPAPAPLPVVAAPPVAAPPPAPAATAAAPNAALAALNAMKAKMKGGGGS